MSSEATDHLAYDIGVILHQANSTEPLYTIRDRIVVERIERAGGPIVLEPGEAEITNETVTLLRLLYARQAPDLQESFAAIVCRAMRTKDARASAATLILIERTRELMEALFRQTFGRNEEEDVSIRIAIWSGVSEVLSRDSHRLTAVDLAQAEVIRFYGESQVPGRSRLGSVLSHELHQVDEVLKLVRFQRLRSELVQGANLEINTDKLALVSGMEQLGFRTDIVDAIHQLDRKVYEAGKPLEFAECMRLARTIFEEIVEDAGRRATALRKHQLPAGGVKGNFSPWKDVLVKTDSLNRGEGILFQALYDYFPNTGTHRLASKREQARIAKNMVTECGLLVVGRVQTLERSEG